MSLEVIRSETAYQGRAFAVRRDQVRLPGGHQVTLDIVDHPGSVTLVPIDQQGRLLFVRQYRHPAGENLLELPAGTLDPGEDPLTCAIRECREEIGMTPGKLTPLATCYLAPGYSSELTVWYLAEDLSSAPLSPDEDENLEIVRLTQQESLDMIQAQTLRDAKSVLGILLLVSRFASS
jgi:ADP-ribose pyrophosphatase